jgi:hypothetical protein
MRRWMGLDHRRGVLPELLAVSKPRLHSKSSMQCAATCLQRYDFMYNHNRCSKYTKDFLVFGSAFHAGVEAFWLGAHLPFKERVKAMHTACDEFLLNEGGHKNVDPNKLKVLMACYCDRWGSDDYEVLGVEADYNDGQFRGIFDALVKFKGRTLLVDTKTTKSDIKKPDDRYWKLDLDFQCGLYHHLAEHNGFTIDGFVYDVIKIPPMKQGKDGRKHIDENSEEYVSRLATLVQKDYDKWFQRRVIDTNPEHAMKAAFGMARTIDAGDFFPTPQSCHYIFGSTCEFAPVCNGDTTLADDTLYTIRRPTQ